MRLVTLYQCHPAKANLPALSAMFRAGRSKSTGMSSPSHFRDGCQRLTALEPVTAGWGLCDYASAGPRIFKPSPV